MACESPRVGEFFARPNVLPGHGHAPGASRGDEAVLLAVLLHMDRFLGLLP